MQDLDNLGHAIALGRGEPSKHSAATFSTLSMRYRRLREKLNSRESAKHRAVRKEEPLTCKAFPVEMKMCPWEQGSGSHKSADRAHIELTTPSRSRNYFVVPSGCPGPERH